MTEANEKRRRHRHLERERFRYKPRDTKVLLDEIGGNSITLKVGRGISPDRARVERMVSEAASRQEEA